jgi:ABC-type antimicrobial peptide transport system permease subunit
MSRSVIRRTVEIGIRRALGATNGNTLNVFLREGAITLVIGLVVGGIPATLAIVGIAGVLPFMLDYLKLIGPIAVAVISVTILAASYWPASRLTALEPGDALQCN